MDNYFLSQVCGLFVSQKLKGGPVSGEIEEALIKLTDLLNSPLLLSALPSPQKRPSQFRFKVPAKYLNVRVRDILSE